MLLDFEVQRSTRRCAATDTPLQPGDTCYSVLEARGAEVVRSDYSSKAWSGPPEGAFAWWKWRVPEAAAKKMKLAPNDVLLELFDQVSSEPDQSDLRYVLALLLVRRRVFRLEAQTDVFHQGEKTSASDSETLLLYCPKRDVTHQVVAATPSEERIDEIQQHLAELIIAGAE